MLYNKWFTTTVDLSVLNEESALISTPTSSSLRPVIFASHNFWSQRDTKVNNKSLTKNNKQFNNKLKGKGKN